MARLDFNGALAVAMRYPLGLVPQGPDALYLVPVLSLMLFVTHIGASSRCPAPALRADARRGAALHREPAAVRAAEVRAVRERHALHAAALIRVVRRRYCIWAREHICSSGGHKHTAQKRPCASWRPSTV